MATETRNPNAGALTCYDFAAELPVPAPTLWDQVTEDMPPKLCRFGTCAQCDTGTECPTAAQRPYDETGPAWFCLAERHRLLAAVLLVAIGACPFFWR